MEKEKAKHLVEVFNQQVHENEYLQEYLSISETRERINFHSQLAIIYSEIERHQEELLKGAATELNIILTEVAEFLIPERAEFFDSFTHHDFIKVGSSATFKILNQDENEEAFSELVTFADNLFKKIRYAVIDSYFPQKLKKFKQKIEKFVVSTQNIGAIYSISLELNLLMLRRLQISALSETISIYGYIHNPTELEIRGKINDQRKSSNIGNPEFNELKMPPGFYNELERLLKKHPNKSKDWYNLKLRQRFFDGDESKKSTVYRRITDYLNKYNK